MCDIFCAVHTAALQVSIAGVSSGFNWMINTCSGTVGGGDLRFVAKIQLKSDRCRECSYRLEMDRF